MPRHDEGLRSLTLAKSGSTPTSAPAIAAAHLKEAFHDVIDSELFDLQGWSLVAGPSFYINELQDMLLSTRRACSALRGSPLDAVAPSLRMLDELRVVAEEVRARERVSALESELKKERRRSAALGRWPVRAERALRAQHEAVTAAASKGGGVFPHGSYGGAKLRTQGIRRELQGATELCRRLMSLAAD